ncbi:MAG: carbonic anhydrase [Alphaproteobacteria bacterium]
MPIRTLERLVDGFRAFRESYYEANKPLFDALAREGQAPKVMVIGCADSRVDPLLILGAGPGDVFVVRNVANLVPPYAPDGRYHGTSAALEFAVQVLGVEHIVVLGHAQCGGVRALIEGSPVAGKGDDFVGAWMSIAGAARDRVAALPVSRRQRAGEHATVKVSLDNLMTFPWIAERVAGSRLALHGWYFDIETGRLLQLDPSSQSFRDMPET